MIENCRCEEQQIRERRLHVHDSLATKQSWTVSSNRTLAINVRFGMSLGFFLRGMMGPAVLRRFLAAEGGASTAASASTAAASPFGRALAGGFLAASPSSSSEVAD